MEMVTYSWGLYLQHMGTVIERRLWYLSETDDAFKLKGYFTYKGPRRGTSHTGITYRTQWVTPRTCTSANW